MRTAARSSPSARRIGSRMAAVSRWTIARASPRRPQVGQDLGIEQADRDRLVERFDLDGPDRRGWARQQAEPDDGGQQDADPKGSDPDLPSGRHGPQSRVARTLVAVRSARLGSSRRGRGRPAGEAREALGLGDDGPEGRIHQPQLGRCRARARAARGARGRRLLVLDGARRHRRDARPGPSRSCPRSPTARSWSCSCRLRPKASAHVSREVNLALGRKRAVLPVRIENVATGGPARVSPLARPAARRLPAADGDPRAADPSPARGDPRAAPDDAAARPARRRNGADGQARRAGRARARARARAPRAEAPAHAEAGPEGSAERPG